MKNIHPTHSYYTRVNHLLRRFVAIFLFSLVVMPAVYSSAFIECGYDEDQLLTTEEMNKMLEDNRFIAEIDEFYQSMSLLYCSGVYHGNVKVQGHALNQIAFYHYSKGELSEALELLIRGHTYNKKENYVHGMIDYHCYMGLISQDLGNTENTLVHFRSMLKLAEEEKNDRWQADAYINMGSTYSRKGELDAAEQYFNTALDILSGGVANESIGWANSHLGSIYAHRGDTTTAVTYFDKAIDIWSEHEAYRGLAYVYNDLGVMMKFKDKERSIAYHNLALQYALDSDFRTQQLSAKVGLGKTYAVYKSDSAFYYLDEVLASDEPADLYYKEKASRTLMQLASDLGDNTGYLKYLQMHHGILQERLNVQSNEHRNWMRLERDMLSLEQEAYKQSLAAERSEARNRLLLLGFGTLVLLVIGLARFVYKYLQTSRQKEEANKRLNENLALLQFQSDELALRNKELDRQKTTLNGQLANKLAMVREIHLKNDKLKAAIASFEINNQEKRKLIKIIDNDTNTEILQNLDHELEQVHSSLFAKLVQAHPKLTSNNLKLISYIKMHLSNKEIADLLYISPDSVKMAKNRLKKKLSLGSSESIDFYIHSLDSKDVVQ